MLKRPIRRERSLATFTFPVSATDQCYFWTGVRYAMDMLIVSVDPMSTSNKTYSCICSDRHYDSQCQCLKSKLDISLHNLQILSFLLTFFFAVSNHSKPTLTIIIQKLTLSQRTVIFRISVVYHIVHGQIES